MRGYWEAPPRVHFSPAGLLSRFSPSRQRLYFKYAAISGLRKAQWPGIRNTIPRGPFVACRGGHCPFLITR